MINVDKVGYNYLLCYVSFIYGNKFIVNNKSIKLNFIHPLNRLPIIFMRKVGGAGIIRKKRKSKTRYKKKFYKLI